MSVATPHATNISDITTSLPFNNTTSHMGGLPGNSKSSGVLLAIFLSVLALLGIILTAIGCTYMYRSKRLSRICDYWNRQRRRRLSSASSQHALDYDGTSIDVPGHRREANLFSIDDEEPNRENDDGYFYDEVFERSAFVDAKTNAALKELYVNPEDELPDLSLREPRY
ncbi:uncharacterized protein LOC132544415 [Ylistrum balloti]|uniref:uncharacterized protein LOC132544415 n=1 Tax=Ylistrum balloti TaxID=509963 RepID=UPI00290596B1|nr:uncharacterized protein LOC132544415 [Ylistrum balloti]